MWIILNSNQFGWQIISNCEPFWMVNHLETFRICTHADRRPHTALESFELRISKPSDTLHTLDVIAHPYSSPIFTLYCCHRLWIFVNYLKFTNFLRKANCVRRSCRPAGLRAARYSMPFGAIRWGYHLSGLQSVDTIRWLSLSRCHSMDTIQSSSYPVDILHTQCIRPGELGIQVPIGQAIIWTIR